MLDLKYIVYTTLVIYRALYFEEKFITMYIVMACTTMWWTLHTKCTFSYLTCPLSLHCRCRSECFIPPLWCRKGKHFTIKTYLKSVSALPRVHRKGEQRRFSSLQYSRDEGRWAQELSEQHCNRRGEFTALPVPSRPPIHDEVCAENPDIS